MLPLSHRLVRPSPCVRLGEQCQANGTEYTPVGRKKKKQAMSTGDNDDDQYVDLSDDEIVIEGDDDDDLSDLYPGT